MRRAWVQENTEWLLHEEGEWSTELSLRQQLRAAPSELGAPVGREVGGCLGRSPPGSQRRNARAWHASALQSRKQECGRGDWGR